jgi:hypothetical protein
MSALLIFSPRDSPRLQYVLEEVFARRFSIEFALCTDLEAFLAHSGPRLFYAPDPPPVPDLWVPATTFLFEKGWKAPLPGVVHREALPGLFPVQGAEEREWPFDLFAALFFLLSRYEEYQSAERDEHGRFPARASLAFRQGFLEVPVADRWLAQLARSLEERFPGLSIARPAFSFCPTFDIDQAWAFRHKPAWRQMGGLAKDAIQGRFRLVFERIGVWSGLIPDPFDRFSFILESHKAAGFTPIFFFLVGDPGPYDKNNPPQDPAFLNLVGKIAAQAPVGLHPSYRSAGVPERLSMEKKRLEQLTGRKVKMSRQHFLRLNLPISYQQLLEAGIREDFTMGYADAPGFRAGTAVPFFWYDLEKEERTSLLVHPFMAMDVTLRQYLGLSPDSAVEKVRSLAQQVRQTGGAFTTIWHNSSFHRAGGWNGWKRVFLAVLEEMGTAPEGSHQ